MAAVSLSRHCSEALKVLIFQAGLTVTIAISSLLLSVVDYELIIGAGIGLLANAIFYVYLFKYQGAQHAQQIVNSFYKGEVAKFAIIVVGFYATFRYLDLQTPILVLIGFMIIQSVYWLYPLLHKRR